MPVRATLLCQPWRCPSEPDSCCQPAALPSQSMFAKDARPSQSQAPSDARPSQSMVATGARPSPAERRSYRESSRRPAPIKYQHAVNHVQMTTRQQQQNNNNNSNNNKKREQKKYRRWRTNININETEAFINNKVTDGGRSFRR